MDEAGSSRGVVGNSPSVIWTKQEVLVRSSSSRIGPSIPSRITCRQGGSRGLLTQTSMRAELCVEDGCAATSKEQRDCVLCI
jgi:hypothetical protein